MPDHDDGLHFTHPTNTAPHTRGGPPKPGPDNADAGWTNTRVREAIDGPRVECICLHVFDYHEDGGTCRVMLTDSLGTEYAECGCAEYREATNG